MPHLGLYYDIPSAQGKFTLRGIAGKKFCSIAPEQSAWDCQKDNFRNGYIDHCSMGLPKLSEVPEQYLEGTGVSFGIGPRKIYVSVSGGELLQKLPHHHHQQPFKAAGTQRAFPSAERGEGRE